VRFAQSLAVVKLVSFIGYWEEKRMFSRGRQIFLGRRRLLPALAAAFLVMLTVRSDAAGPWPFAVGGGWTVAMDQFAFSALQGPSSTRGGYGSFGHARIDSTALGGTVQGPVLCVLVGGYSPLAGGSEAWFVFQNNDPTTSTSVPTLRVYVVDRGDPGILTDSIGWDVVGANCVPNPNGDRTMIPADLTPTGTQLVVKGNIVVQKPDSQ
jgi:hypothetical protein